MPYFLTCLAIFKNEAMNLKEWLDHHLWQGVEHFYLINNGSEDGYMEVLKEYIERGQVSLFDRPERYVQEKHYNEVYKSCNSKWLMVIDLDEFFYCKQNLLPDVTTVADLLRYYEKDSQEDNWGGLYSSWKLFGSSGVVEHPCGKVRETFVHRSGGCWQPKGIVLVERTKELHIHAHDHGPFKIVFNSNYLQLNHYAIQSREYYETVKMTRGDATNEPSNTIRDWNYFRRYDYRDIVDTELRDYCKTCAI